MRFSASSRARLVSRDLDSKQQLAQKTRQSAASLPCAHPRVILDKVFGRHNDNHSFEPELHNPLARIRLGTGAGSAVQTDLERYGGNCHQNCHHAWEHESCRARAESQVLEKLKI